MKRRAKQYLRLFKIAGNALVLHTCCGLLLFIRTWHPSTVCFLQANTKRMTTIGAVYTIIHNYVFGHLLIIANIR